MKKLKNLVSGILLAFCCFCTYGQKREVAVTFDDLPFSAESLAETTRVNELLIGKLKAARVPAI